MTDPARAVLSVSDQVPSGTYVATLSASNDASEPQSSTSTLTIELLSDASTGWVLNEFLADPPPGLEGDANGDGTRHSIEDEFVELVNLTGSNQDISSWTLSDSLSLVHFFPPGSLAPEGEAVLVFGGGAAAGTFGGALVQTASTGRLNLNNDGDTIFFKSLDGKIQALALYGSEGGKGQSLNLDPDLTGEARGLHSQLAGSGGRLFSPGARIDGAPFGKGIPLRPAAATQAHWILYCAIKR